VAPPRTTRADRCEALDRHVSSGEVGHSVATTFGSVVVELVVGRTVVVLAGASVVVVLGASVVLDVDVLDVLLVDVELVDVELEVVGTLVLVDVELLVLVDVLLVELVLDVLLVELLVLVVLLVLVLVVAPGRDVGFAIGLRALRIASTYGYPARRPAATHGRYGTPRHP